MLKTLSTSSVFFIITPQKNNLLTSTIKSEKKKKKRHLETKPPLNRGKRKLNPKSKYIRYMLYNILNNNCI